MAINLQKAKTGRVGSGAARSATVAAIQWVKKYWPAVLKRLRESDDERILLELGKLMLAYAYGKPREMVEHTGEVVHSYVVEAPPRATSPEEWQKTVVLPAETSH